MFVSKVDVGSVRNLMCQNSFTRKKASMSQESDVCPVQDIEVAIDGFSVVMSSAIKMSNSPIGGAGEFSCPPESVD